MCTNLILKEGRKASPIVGQLCGINFLIIRLTLESWYTNSEKEPLNQCQQLPAPYKRLIHDLKRNQPTNNSHLYIEGAGPSTEP